MTEPRMLLVAISGRAYLAACDPKASSVPVQENWPVPTQRRKGRGFQWEYWATVDQAELIESHLRTVGENFAYYGDDPATKLEGRVLLESADRVRRLLKVTVR